MKLVNKKSIYILFLFVICLLMAVVVPTYAKFGSSYSTDEDVATFVLDFDVSITDVDEYEELVIAAGDKYKFNVNVKNSSGSSLYYGIWYRMVSPDTLNNNISIGRYDGSSVQTSGIIINGGTITATIVIINNTDGEIVVDIGVATSSSSVNDIEYLDGRYLISRTISIPSDVSISSIMIDGVTSDSLPTGGYYDMSYSCSKGSKLSWDSLSKTLTYNSTSYIMDNCSLTFTSSTDYPLLNTMPVGSYVKYVGTGGTVGSTSVKCKTNGTASSSSHNVATESPNSCSGQNAREDLDSSNYTYGSCSADDADKYKYYRNGWRLAYIDSSKPVIVSGGAPECVSITFSESNNVFIKTANAKALKYCNSTLVDGNCTCTDSNSDGLCDSASTDAWALNEVDFYNITKAVSGVGKRLTSSYNTSLGDTGGTWSELYCVDDVARGYKECGYTNDLLDIGGLYWFASAANTSTSSTYNQYGIYWQAQLRWVRYVSISYALGLRPVVSLSSSVYVTGGSGTVDDPYIIAK